MKIISLNVNNFSGLDIKPTQSNSNYLDKRSNWNMKSKTHEHHSIKITEYLLENTADVICIQEYDYNSASAKFMKDTLEKNGYTMILPNGSTENSYNKAGSDWSITVTFIKNFNYNIPKRNKDLIAYARMVKLEILGGNSNLFIIGVHIPLAQDSKMQNYWKTLIDYYSINKDSKVLIIGDMNVYKFGTQQKSYFIELLSLGAIDTWVMKKNSMDRPTFNNGSRLDYALVSSSLYNDLFDICIDDEMRNNGFTDHSALIVELKVY